MAAQASPKSKAQLDAEFTELYRAHLRDVYSYAYYRVGNHHDAEDLTEQTFLQAYRHFERAQRESEGRPLRPWLIRIAHNLAANLYRDRSRKPASPIDETTTITAPHTTEQLVEGRDELSRILDGVGKLPDDRREALIMRFALGMDNREIARALGRSDGATKVLIHRAIKQLEEIVGENGSGRRPAKAPRKRRRPTMSEAATNFEGLLREALAPVEPPAELAARLEGALQSITEMAADELEAWELSAMRDPRNWVRPAAALAVGGAAATALVVLRARRRAAASPPRSIAGVRKAAEPHDRRPRARDAPAARRPLKRPGRPRPRARLSLRHGHLLPPPLARDRRVLLELRAPDLPGLHDEHARRHALPGVRAASARRSSACATWPRVPRVTYALIAINVIVFLTEQGQFTLREHGRPRQGRSPKASSTAKRSPKPTSTGAWSPRASCTRTCCTSASTCTCSTCSG